MAVRASLGASRGRVIRQCRREPHAGLPAASSDWRCHLPVSGCFCNDSEGTMPSWSIQADGRVYGMLVTVCVGTVSSWPWCCPVCVKASTSYLLNERGPAAAPNQGAGGRQSSSRRNSRSPSCCWPSSLDVRSLYEAQRTSVSSTTSILMTASLSLPPERYAGLRADALLRRDCCANSTPPARQCRSRALAFQRLCAAPGADRRTSPVPNRRYRRIDGELTRYSKQWA